MTTTTTTLTDFLMARIAEDEAAAREATAGPWTAYGDGILLGTSENPEVCRGVKTWNMWHLSTFDPARVLAECAAKRAIADLHRPQFLDLGDADGMDRSGYYCETCDDLPESIWPCATVRHLAAVYADHPDYDPSWAVS